MQRASGGLRIGLFGLACDTGNSGVSALAHSVLAGIAAHAPANTQVTLFDHGQGSRPAALVMPGGSLRYERCGAVHSRRPARRESYFHIRLAERMRLPNPTLRAVQDCDVILDASGGDSFSDLYGAKRFRAMVEPKLLALRLGKPLVLLPQTYGPFSDPSTERIARRIVCQASSAWSRDPRGFETLRTLVAGMFEPTRHREGVDLAFALPSFPPDEQTPIMQHLQASGAGGHGRPRVGLNVSGLLFDAGRISLGINLDYPELMRSLVRRILHRTSAEILLVPSVIPSEPKSAFESDLAACQAVVALTEPGMRDRVHVVDDVTRPEHLKWIIAQCDWFAGSRMHATIAALSSGVPCAGLAYSDKFQGVFESAQCGCSVVDLRVATTSHALDAIWRQWCDQERTRERLSLAIESTVALAHAEMTDIVASCARQRTIRGAAA